jgi:hypothetical protein
LDLDVISQRIIQVAQAAAEEHVASIARSQADRLLDLVAQADAPDSAPTTQWTPPHSNRMRF